MESLQPHDALVSPVLRFIKAHVLQGLEDEAWLEEQLLFLLERMQAHRSNQLMRIDALKLSRAVTRREIFRRIGYATDLLHTHYARPLDLDALSAVAYLSKYHFLRLFTLVHGMTPMTYLQRKRTRAALRLLRTTNLTVDEVACSVGFARRSTVLRQIQRWTGLRPTQIRTAALEHRALEQLIACPT
jgi:AraC-like DNA-binding protein